MQAMSDRAPLLRPATSFLVWLGMRRLPSPEEDAGNAADESLATQRERRPAAAAPRRRCGRCWPESKLVAPASAPPGTRRAPTMRALSESPDRAKQPQPPT